MIVFFVIVQKMSLSAHRKSKMYCPVRHAIVVANFSDTQCKRLYKLISFLGLMTC